MRIQPTKDGLLWRVEKSVLAKELWFSSYSIQVPLSKVGIAPAMVGCGHLLPPQGIPSKIPRL